MNNQTRFNLGIALLLAGLAGFAIWQQRQIALLKAERIADGAAHFSPEVEKLRQEIFRLRGEQKAAMEKQPPSSAEVQAMSQQLAALKAEAAKIASSVENARSTRSTRRTSVPTGFVSAEVSDLGNLTSDGFEFMPSRSTDMVAGKGPRWSHSQAAGPPDTEGGGDIVTAWAPRSIHMGEQWLQVGYAKAVEVGAINIHETYNPGAISKVAAILPDGREQLIWSGTAPGGEPPVETSIPVPKGVTSDKIKIYVDTDRVDSWPEIDAVEMVGTDGSKQWANSTTASSYFGDDQGSEEVERL